MISFALKAEKVKKVNHIVREVALGYCGAREATLGCENFDSGIVKSVEWYLGKYKV